MIIWKQRPLWLAVNGVYSTMRWYVGGERYYSLTEYGVDYVWEGADGGNKDAFNKYSNQLNSSFGMLYEFWGKEVIKVLHGLIRL